ncbi:MAG: hypothetical protein GX167_03550 [Firmicutes bacterium]|jgi:predicted  nucleic acid-binding Zn-ribbon protein|nr:hypothetical protein [Bacillota bacterium]
MTELQNLYRLQQVDLQVEQLQKELKTLPVIAAFQQLQNKTLAAKKGVMETENKLKDCKKLIRHLEFDLQQIEAEQKDIQAVLYGGSSHKAKELASLEKKAGRLRREQTELEEKLLAALETKEALEQALPEAREKYKILYNKLLVLQKSGNAEIHELKSRLARLQAEREALLAQISENLLAEYKKRRAQYQGKPLARIENDICSGCRVVISFAVQRSLQQFPGNTYCENCGRLLVPRE